MEIPCTRDESNEIHCTAQNNFENFVPNLILPGIGPDTQFTACRANSLNTEIVLQLHIIYFSYNKDRDQSTIYIYYEL